MSMIDNLIRELPANCETVAFPKEAYFELLSEIDAMRAQLKSSTSVIKDADVALKAAERKMEEQVARIAQLTQWLESAENACMEKDNELGRLRVKPTINQRAEKARAQRMAAMGIKTVHATDKQGHKVAAVEVPVPAEERIKALCQELAQLKGALDIEHDRHLEARREIERLNERLRVANSDLLDTKTDLLAAQQGLIDLNHAYKQIRTTAQQLVKQKAELEEQLKKSKSANKLLTTQRDALHHAVSHPARVEQLEAEIAHLKQENARMTIQLENACKEIEGRQKTIEALRLRNDRLDNQANERHVSLRTELDHVRRELRAACETRDYYMSLVRSIRDAVTPTAEHA